MADAKIKPPELDGRLCMQGETKELWFKLCEQAAVEQDPDKLLQLVKEINRLLEEKEERLVAARKHRGTA